MEKKEEGGRGKTHFSVHKNRKSQIFFSINQIKFLEFQSIFLFFFFFFFFSFFSSSHTFLFIFYFYEDRERPFESSKIYFAACSLVKFIKPKLKNVKSTEKKKKKKLGFYSLPSPPLSNENQCKAEFITFV